MRITNGANNVVGGAGPEANAIAFNGKDGVSVVGGDSNSTGNRILSNSISSNGDLGVDLKDDGVTDNDPKDPDKGPNTLQNFPVLSSAKVSDGGQISIAVTLNSRPRKTFTIQFFLSNAGDSTSEGKGERYLGQKTVKTNRRGKASFTFSATPGALLANPPLITATATDTTGNTSEFSAPKQVQR